MSKAFLTAKQTRVMQLSNEDRMQDTADIYNYTTSRDAMGQLIKTWAKGSSIVCGFGFSPFKFRARELSTFGGDESSEILVRARVSLDYQSEIQPDSRMHLTSRYGVAVNPEQVYEVQGFNEIGPDAMIVNLKRVEL